MRISANKINVPSAEKVKITRDTVQVDLSDGERSRCLWLGSLVFNRLRLKRRNNWSLIGKGQGIHWSDMDEDISIEGLLADRPSRESQMDGRNKNLFRKGKF